MKIFFAFLFCLLCVSVSYSQDEILSPEYLEADYKQVDVVLHVDSKNFEIADDIGGYKLYRITAEVKEVFKGKLSAQEKSLVFYVSTDSDYPAKNLLGEHVVFLKYSNSDKLKIKRGLWQLENSTRPASKEVVERLRKIKAKLQKKKR